MDPEPEESGGIRPRSPPLGIEFAVTDRYRYQYQQNSLLPLRHPYLLLRSKIILECSRYAITLVRGGRKWLIDTILVCKPTIFDIGDQKFLKKIDLIVLYFALLLAKIVQIDISYRHIMGIYKAFHLHFIF